MRDEPNPRPDASAPADKARAVQRMFAAIAPRYDLLNRLLTLGTDRRWRRRAVDRLLAGRPRDGAYLDACAGTMDLAREIARRPEFRGAVLACDFATPMLERGREKVAGLAVLPAAADALRLPFGDAVMDGAIVGFGVRNLADLDAGLRELGRVLRPGGRLVVLELSLPRVRVLRALYLLYFARILPWIGRRVSRHEFAYTYLPESVRAFATPEALAERLRAAGFEAVEWETLFGGVAAIHVGVRASPASRA